MHDIKREALQKHKEWKGKIEVTARVQVRTNEELSIAYTPGVAELYKEIPYAETKLDLPLAIINLLLTSIII